MLDNNYAKLQATKVELSVVWKRKKWRKVCREMYQLSLVGKRKGEEGMERNVSDDCSGEKEKGGRYEDKYIS